MLIFLIPQIQNTKETMHLMQVFGGWGKKDIWDDHTNSVWNTSVSHGGEVFQMIPDGQVGYTIIVEPSDFHTHQHQYYMYVTIV